MYIIIIDYYQICECQTLLLFNLHKCCVPNKTVSVETKPSVNCAFIFGLALTCFVRMASVVFIIRVPYEGNSESTKAEAKNESFIEETEGEGLTGSTDEQNVKEVKFEIDKKTDKRPNENEVGVGDDTNEADQSAHDVEMFTGPLNLAQVGVFTWKIFHYFMTENNNKNNKYIYDHCDGN